jgi:Tol biopolymer transport system component
VAQFPDAVTPDGAYLLGHENSPETNFDVIRVPLNAASATNVSESLIHTKFIELNADVSPDGRYFAYQSNESGVNEIYVRPYPNLNAGRWQVSSAGGTRPSWARTGREIFYLDATGALTSVAVQTAGTTFSAGNAAKLFDTTYATPINARTYDASPDGLRFLMIKEAASADKNTPSLVVVEHWVEELKAKVSAK